MDRARNAIRSLADLAPTLARVRQADGTDREVPIEDVHPGDVVVVRPGDRVPVDGDVVSGHSAIDQASITGESVPVEKVPGDAVFAGTVNGVGALEVTTTAAAGDRTLDRVVKLVEEAQREKAPTQRFTDRFEQIFVPIVLVASALLAVLPPLLMDWTWGTAFYRAMALLVGASPCALALGTPAAVLAGIARAARGGVLIKGGESLENLGALRALAFDKTGTLTVGRPEVTDVVPAEGVGRRRTAAGQRCGRGAFRPSAGRRGGAAGRGRRVGPARGDRSGEPDRAWGAGDGGGSDRRDRPAAAVGSRRGGGAGGDRNAADRTPRRGPQRDGGPARRSLAGGAGRGGRAAAGRPGNAGPHAGAGAAAADHADRRPRRRGRRGGPRRGRGPGARRSDARRQGGSREAAAGRTRPRGHGRRRRERRPRAWPTPPSASPWAGPAPRWRWKRPTWR